MCRVRINVTLFNPPGFNPGGVWGGDAPPIFLFFLPLFVCFLFVFVLFVFSYFFVFYFLFYFLSLCLFLFDFFVVCF